MEELRGRKPVWGEVKCEKHGKRTVALAKNRREKQGHGCPECRKEKAKESHA